MFALQKIVDSIFGVPLRLEPCQLVGARASPSRLLLPLFLNDRLLITTRRQLDIECFGKRGTDSLKILVEREDDAAFLRFAFVLREVLIYSHMKRGFDECISNL